jgi:Uma2 family endonuclease
VSVVEGSPRDPAGTHPTDALLVVEVADTSLRFDRAEKAAVYARAGIRDYWIVNLRDRVLEVHREPAPMAEQPLGRRYRSITRHTGEDAVSPLFAPGVRVAVADLIPSVD